MNIIIENCNVCQLDVGAKDGLKLYNAFTIRHPNAFYLRKSIKGWDGKVHFINKTGQFKIGLLPHVIQEAKKLGIKVNKIIDQRKDIQVPKKIITHIGNYTLRPEQIRAVQAVLNNKIKGIPYFIGVLDYTVNAGKSLIMSALYLTFKRKLKTLLITNDASWLTQAKREFKDYLPGEDITFVQGSKVQSWSNFSIGMIQSISRNIKRYQNELSQIEMVLVDEADLAGSKSYQNVLMHLYNTKVRIGLSGTIYMSKLKKDELKNMNLESFFGPILTRYTLKQSIKEGNSTNTIVKLIPYKTWYGNDYESHSNTFQEEYNKVIIDNQSSYNMVEDRVRYNLRYGRLPLLIVCKYVKHCENICEILKFRLDKNLKIACVHVDTPQKERKKILEAFREGNLDILVSTTIIARGKNFPLLKCMINAACMDGQEKSIQFLGRLVRTSKGKTKAYLDDLQFPGRYLSRHGNHRKRYYKEQGLKVIDLKKYYKDYELPF